MELKKKQDSQIKKITLTFEEYEKIARSLLHHVIEHSELSDNLITQGALVEWYLEKNMRNVTTEADLKKLEKICNSVVERMIRKDNNLMVDLDLEDDSQQDVK